MEDFLNLPRQLAHSNRIVTLEEASDKERASAGRIQEISQSDGVIVGILRGHSPQDIRAAVLEGGEVYVLRVTPSALSDNHKAYKQLRQCYQQLSSVEGLRPDSTRYGESAGRIWLKRKYYEQTLSKQTIDECPFIGSEAELLAELFRVLEPCFTRGLYHGHISPGNIVIGSNQLYLVDFGLAFIERISRGVVLNDFAPEIINSNMILPQTDMFGLGLTLKSILGREIEARQMSALQGMLSSAPTSRPEFHEIASIFETTGTKGKSLPQRDLSKGRMLGSELSQAQVESQPRLDVTETIISTDLKIVDPLKDTPQSERIDWRADESPWEQDRPQTSSSSNADSQSNLGLSSLIVIVAVIAVGWLYRDRIAELIQGEEGQIPFAIYWEQGSPEQIHEVALSALDGNALAMRVVIRSLTGNNPPSFANAELARDIFDPRWRKDLTRQDKLAAIALSLNRIVPEGLDRLPPFPSLGPGLILAVIGNQSIDRPSSQISKIPLSVMYKLPLPFGLPFQLLSKGGETDFSSFAARALVKVIVERGSPDSLLLFLGGEGVSNAETRIAALTMLLDEIPTLAKDLVELSKKHKGIPDPVAWFGDNSLADWSKTPDKVKLSIFLGALPPKYPFTRVQLADLLAFPQTQVREQARVQISGKEGAEGIQSTLSFLAQNKHALSRYQIVSLISLLLLEADKRLPYVSEWFASNPDSISVLEIVALRSDAPALDVFNIEAARYLGRTEWKGKLNMYKKLVLHPEPLVRALVYSKLDLENYQERKLLADMATIEPDAKIRMMIGERLESAEELGGE